ncbi:hypothetical protein PYW08_014961 [Mythimna loreyi]|uniref:Uncharacterized protein n=1 Tax=Mythimna loreyi TaxID=667449 RepID=A0ACC2R3Y9_9NEOP|nr:hypothetical protein PYW08_014961 [Mythimna loreyi]
MDDPDLYIDELTDTSESESSEPSLPSSEEGLFKPNTPFVLELHDIRKDDPAMPPAPPTNPDPLIEAAVAKVKKHRKKKKASDAAAAAKERRASLTDSMSDASSIEPSATSVKEEFYDARESYHAVAENEALPTIAQEVTEPEVILPDTQEPMESKAPDREASSQQQTSTQAAQKEASVISKPTEPP